MWIVNDVLTIPPPAIDPQYFLYPTLSLHIYRGQLLGGSCFSIILSLGVTITVSQFQQIYNRTGCPAGQVLGTILRLDLPLLHDGAFLHPRTWYRLCSVRLSSVTCNTFCTFHYGHLCVCQQIDFYVYYKSFFLQVFVICLWSC